MKPQKRNGLLKVRVKWIGLWLICLSIAGILSCNWGTNSTASSAGSSGTGTGWTITIQIGKNPVSFYGTTTINAIVRDRTGTPAPMGTNICTTVTQNSLLKPGAGVDPESLLRNICETTTNELGQSIQTYAAISVTGIDTVEVSSQGVVSRATITVQ